MLTKTVLITGIPRSGVKIATQFLAGNAGWIPEQERRYPRITLYSNKELKPLNKNEPDPLVFSQDPTYMYEWKPIHALYPDACWIIVRRDNKSVIESCKRTGWLNYCGSSDACWNSWLQSNLEIMHEMKARVDWIEVWPTQCLNGNLTCIEEAVNHFKLGGS